MLEAARVTTSRKPDLGGRMMEAARIMTPMKPDRMRIAQISFAYEEETMNKRR